MKTPIKEVVAVHTHDNESGGNYGDATCPYCGTVNKIGDYQPEVLCRHFTDLFLREGDGEMMVQFKEGDTHEN